MPKYPCKIRIKSGYQSPYIVAYFLSFVNVDSALLRERFRMAKKRHRASEDPVVRPYCAHMSATPMRYNTNVRRS